ncbi:MAG: M23 family metallopeptidase [Rhodospirillales bacterium]|jgi:hypothetical protein
MRNGYITVIVLGLLAIGFPYQSVAAESKSGLGKSISFRLPIRCTPGQNCWIVNHVDTDPSKGAADYSCGNKAYNRHKGTDFALRDLAVMRSGFQSSRKGSHAATKGVPVVAAADGVVLGMRNGVPDVDFRERGGVTALKGQDCGNGVRIQHAGGWTTQYCHLRYDSVQVRGGQRVKAGRWLGFVGLSGRTEFPHLHFQVSLNKDIVDPFTGLPQGAGCGQSFKSLWNEQTEAQLPYRPTNIYMGGFIKSKPSAKAARSGYYQNIEIPRTANSIKLWADIFGLRKGDNLIFEIFAPSDTRILAAKTIIRRTQIRKFFSATTRKTQALWPAGAYRGEIRLIRKSAKGKAEVYRLRRITNLR